jgi:hypothetical protein
MYFLHVPFCPHKIDWSPMGDVNNSETAGRRNLGDRAGRNRRASRTFTQMVIRSLRRNGTQGWIVMPPAQPDGCSGQQRIERNRD